MLEARILAVADVFEAMTSHRPYRPAATVAQAVEYIQGNVGTKFDPAVVEAFLNILAEEHEGITPTSSLTSYTYSHPVNPDEKQPRTGTRRVIRRRILVRRRV